MHRDRVAVVEATLVEIAHRQDDLGARVELDRERPGSSLDGRDGAAIAVQHAEPALVPHAQDSVAGAEGALSQPQLRSLEPPRGAHEGAGALV